MRNVLLIMLLLICVLSLWQAQLVRVRVSSPEMECNRVGNGHPSPSVPQHIIHMAVLNGSGQAGLARRFSRQLSTLGCVIVAIANAPHDSFSTSLLINRRLPKAIAKQLAAQLNGVPLLQEWDHRSQEEIILVLGQDYRRLLAQTPVNP